MRAYFDNGTTELLSMKAKEAIAESLLTDIGLVRDNSSFGKKGIIALESCRYEIATRLDCKTGELIFTSGGTEAMNQAIYSAVSMMNELGRTHILTGTMEPMVITILLNQLEALGFTVSCVMENREGNLEVSELSKFLKPETGLLITSAVNEATGVIKPLEELSQFSRASDLLFISDFSLLAGRIPLSLHSLDIDYAVFSAHRFGGPQGIGILYARHGVKVTPLIQGSCEEDGRRAGSINTGLAEGMKAALLEKTDNLEKSFQKIKELETLIKENIYETGCTLIPVESPVLPGWINFSVPGLTGEQVVKTLERKGFILSVPPLWNGNEKPVRLLLNESNTEVEIKELLNILYEIKRDRNN